MKSVLFALVASAAAAGAGVAAQPATAPAVQKQDHAGPTRVQTRAEVVNHVRTMFGTLDSDRDGFVTKAEAQAARAHRGDKLRRAHAQRGAAAGAKAFDRFDANNDGTISRAEWDSRTAERRQKRAARATHGKNGGRLTAAGLRGRMFDAADANRDSRISFAEAQNAALQHFDRLDLNRDGSLTPEERRQAREQRRAQRRRG
jgi:Ca2+-binding EF-hand superfamily protein